MRILLKRIITLHPALTLLIMYVSVFIFSVTSYNLFFLLQANASFISEHGLLALSEGGLMQLIELMGLSLLNAVCYIIFKASERVLTDKLLS